MQTDYQRLTRFESALIAMIVLGIAIVGIEVFAGLPERTQASVRESLAIFDVREDLYQTGIDLQFVLDTMTDVQDEFAVALEQSIAIPDQLNMAADLSAPVIAKASVVIAKIENSADLNLAYARGQVLGTSTDSEMPGCGDDEEVASADLSKHFEGYTAPDLRFLTIFPSLIN